MHEQTDRTETTAADAFRRQEANRLAREIDVHADIVLRHLIEMEREGIIELPEHLQHG